ncbi:hypothetical protein AB0F17_29245 [Nonomuraea sp. NPDC026600]|uniref:hypothetical protein n=1 Tax=Nonomuraea sp. NPDC026600 TaxID=3155363 RepID=UPI0033FC8AC2
MIEGYGFVTHVLPRMVPSLAFVALAGLAWLVPLKSAGSGRWVLFAGVLAVTVDVRVTRPRPTGSWPPTRPSTMGSTDCSSCAVRRNRRSSSPIRPRQ